MAEKHIYKIQFINQQQVYEVYAHSVGPAGIPGFVEIGELVFGEKSALLLDPSEEGLKNEFSGVKRSYIPMHCIIRIDEVERQGKAKITRNENGDNIHSLPLGKGNPQLPDGPL